MPEKLRKKGIASKTELIFVMMPFMEWQQTNDIIDKFKKFVDVKDEHDVLRRLSYLCKKGFFERAPGEMRGWRKTTVWRRITREYVDGSSTRQARLDGRWFGRVRKPKVDRQVDKLTMDDVRFMQSYEDLITLKELTKMFKIDGGTVRRIQAGKLPRHLKSKRSE